MNWAKIAFRTLVTLMILAALFFYRQVLGHLIIAVIFSYILDPAVCWLEHKHVPRLWGVLTIYLLLAGAITFFSVRTIPAFMKQANSFIDILKQDGNLNAQLFLRIPIIENIYQYAENLDAQVPGFRLAEQMVAFLDSIRDYMARLPKFLMDNYSTIIGAVTYIGMTPLISFFLLKDKYRLRKGLMRLSTNRFFEPAIILLNNIDKTVGRYMRAMFLEVIAVSIMTTVALTIVGISNPILIGISAGLANIIPYFGPFFAGALAVGTVFFEGGSLIMMIYAALAMWAVQLVDNNIVYPVVVGTTIDMHPLVVLLTVLAGGWYGGIIWMLISVPLVYMSYTLIRVLYTNLKDYRII
ncbi:MAG TPA: AI-2E family transporter [Candidatus Cloacimonetes bacterium]|nr:AI-2E family transporter [Candidatus Cloacimonadota bacterium]